MANPPPLASLLSADALAALDARTRAVVREEIGRPLYVSQRTCERVVALDPETYLEAARRGDFESSKVRRLIVARVEDVERWIESHRRAPVAANDVDDGLDEALAEVGGRRIAR